MTSSTAVKPFVPTDAFVSAPAWSPARGEAWWWLGLPIVFVLAMFAIYAISPEFYRERILPEGYGFLEIGHFLFPLFGFFLAIGVARSALFGSDWLVKAATILFGLTCLYIAGEEMSWGQHILKWGTPEYWAEINRQAETNLHNVSPWFNQRPRLLLEIGVLVGGILVPLWQLLRGPFTNPVLALFAPPPALMPVALLLLAMKVFDHATKKTGDTLLARPNEVVESLLYLFLLYYMIVFCRRVRALDEAGVTQVRP